MFAVPIALVVDSFWTVTWQVASTASVFNWSWFPLICFSVTSVLAESAPPLFDSRLIASVVSERCPFFGGELTVNALGVRLTLASSVLLVEANHVASTIS